MPVTAVKKVFSLEDIEAQTALELPDRETPALVTLTCVVGCIGSISVTVQNIHVAATVCAQVNAINSLIGQQVLTCTTSA